MKTYTSLSLTTIKKILDSKGVYETTDVTEMGRIVHSVSDNSGSKHIYKHFLTAIDDPELTDCLHLLTEQTSERPGHTCLTMTMTNTKTNERIK